MKHFALGSLCVLLAMALGACTEESSPGGKNNPLEWDGEGYFISFDENGGDTPANPQSKIVLPPETTLDTLPEPPTREGHSFVGWNMEADGSGDAFSIYTTVSESLRVYAQWEPLAPGTPRLNVALSTHMMALTPLETDTTTAFRLAVSGFENSVDANNVRLELMNAVEGLSFQSVDSFAGNTKTFNITVGYDGVTAFPESPITLRLSLENMPRGYEYAGGTQSLDINVVDGQAKARAIPIHRNNVEAFNLYAQTELGRRRHYRLTESIVLPPPAENQSNWTAIGTYEAPFLGSFNGAGFSLGGININATTFRHGFFGVIGTGAEIENLGVLEVNIRGANNIGALAGLNRGTVRNCYATGNVVGANYVGGLVGANESGRIENSYASVGITSHGNISWSNTGGLAGTNSSGTIQNCYATGNVSASMLNAGGLVGVNEHGTIQNCYATGSVSGTNYVGGLVGHNYSGGTLRSSMALNPRVSGNSYVGRVTGFRNSSASLSNNLAFSGMTNRQGSALLWSNRGPGNLDGEDKAAANLRVSADFPLVFVNSPWSYAADHLPGLLGQAVPMPVHLQPLP
ncbi:MAG: InlB B-repeat-containing protein [Cystobacterineae bacterium]|nr:InlB B-repeat-containing protein [Cystobacterineae bacterium]